MKITIVYKEKKYEITVEDTITVRDLRVIVEKETGLNRYRQRLWYEKENEEKKEKKEQVVLNVDHKITEDGVKEGMEILMKDLGPQLPFRFVYLMEYFGPLTLYILIWLVARAGGFIKETAQTQTTLALVMWVIHYVKRILETIYVHEFGDMTMPFRNIIKNCTYYYGFAIAVAINVNFFPLSNFCILTGVGLIGMIASIISNGYCHIMLKRLRTPGSQEWKIPKGFLFDYIVTPNYYCEIMTWFFFNVMTGFPLMGIAFNICGTYQMWEWAAARRRKYISIDKNYKVRWTLLPPFY